MNETRSIAICLTATAFFISCATAPSPPGGQVGGGGAAGTIYVDGSAPAAVSTLYGENYWCWDGYGDNMPKIQSLVGPLKLNVLRAGGYNNDANKSSGPYNSDPFGEPQIDAFVAYCRAVGAEPLIQVPLIANYAAHGFPSRAVAEDAAKVVRYANVEKGYGVKYWEIGNEPDLYGDKNNGAVDVPGYGLSKFCDDFNNLSKAMKAVDPSIEILGPELSWKYYPSQTQNGPNDWLTPFLSKCKGSYDIVAVHRYPFAAERCSVEGAMDDVASYVSAVRAIKSLIARVAPGTPFAITEANISWDGEPAHSVYSASPQTIYAALWLADTLCAARKEGLWAQCYWSLSETWTLGIIDPKGSRPRPEYYGLQMVSNGMGPTELAAKSPAGLAAYASRNEANDATVLIVLNKGSKAKTEGFSFERVSGTPAAGASATFPPYSISCVTFPDGGAAPRIVRYSQAEASAGTGPTVVQ